VRAEGNGPLALTKITRWEKVSNFLIRQRLRRRARATDGQIWLRRGGLRSGKRKEVEYWSKDGERRGGKKKTRNKRAIVNKGKRKTELHAENTGDIE